MEQQIEKENNNKRIFKVILFSIILIGVSILVYRLVIYNQNEEGEIIKNETIMECIAKNSTLYTTKTCGYCAKQKEELGEFIYLFNLVDCSDSQYSPTGYNECQMMNIISVPTWIINGESYRGVRDVKELKKLAGC